MANEQQAAAQRELHETRLQHRAAPAQNGHRSFNPDDVEGVHSIIEGLEQAGIGRPMLNHSLLMECEPVLEG